MKKMLLLFAIVFLLLALPAITFIDDQPLAQSGCCMERELLTNQNWYENGLSFRKCRDLNRNRDGDDLYRRRGFIYWEENC